MALGARGGNHGCVSWITRVPHLGSRLLLLLLPPDMFRDELRQPFGDRITEAQCAVYGDVEMVVPRVRLYWRFRHGLLCILYLLLLYCIPPLSGVPVLWVVARLPPAKQA